MRINLKFIKILMYLLITFVLAFLVVFFYEYKNTHTKPPVKNVQGFIKIGRRYNLFVDNQNLRPENVDAVINALNDLSKNITPLQVKWYKMGITALDPNSFILDHAMHVIERNPRTIAFNKDGLSYMAVKLRYFTYNGWVLSVGAKKPSQLDAVLAYINYPDKLNIKVSDNYKCVALDNHCIYITTNVPLGYIKWDQYTADAYLLLFNNIQLFNQGSFKIKTDIGKLYREFINNGGLKYIRLNTVKKGSYVCNSDTCTFGEQLDPGTVLFRNMQVKNYELIYYFIPLSVKPNSLDGYLLPFYKVYLEGSTNSGNDKYLVQMSVLVPAFEYKK